MLTAMLIVNFVLAGTLLFTVARTLHQKDQIRELTELVGDHVADQFLLNEARQELAETKMQLELSRANKP